MSGETWTKLDQHLRLRLADLPAKQFEDFFLHFLNAGVSLTIERHGGKLTRKVISASTYSGEGQDQKGIDLTAEVEGGEEWCFQCKRHKKWTRAQTLAAIEKAKRYQAHHYFLVVACDPPAEVHDEMRKHPNWTLWNLGKICEEFRLKVPPASQPKCLFFLDPDEIKRFVPFASEALVSPEDFFSRFLGPEKLFRHDWKLVGREAEMRALDEFVQSDRPKVLLLVSKGGDGKSRLLWEFTRDIEARMPGTQALFLNPHSHDEPAFAVLTDATKRVVVIDDAHRVEQVPRELLALVRKDPAAKLVLATRPQGVEALASKLFEVGLHDSHQTFSLKKLKKADLKTLATEALGPKLVEHAQALAELTTDCPFLTVLAGELLRQGRMTWGNWASHAEFRQHVFRAFEDENLSSIAGQDKTLARALLRIIAMLAPLPAGANFIEKAARCLGSSVLAVETQLQRLRGAELIVGRDDGLRIIPDLFADFLVYDTCYEPKSKMPVFAQQIITEFSECAPAALRNLAEATWVAQANGVADDTLIQALVADEMRRFEAASFYDRTAMLKRWHTFGVYLPKESLALAHKAVLLDSAPRWDRPHSDDEVWNRLDSHSSVLDELPTLLRPVAEYHSNQCEDALGILWELGHRRGSSDSRPTRNHPWTAIASIVEFKAQGTSVSSSVLGWLRRLFENPENLRRLEDPAPILRNLLQPCFARFVELYEADGRSIRRRTWPVHVGNTRPVREQALGILRHVIEAGSWLAALDALSALEVAIQRFRPMYADLVDDPEEFRREWLPERLAALALYEVALARHTHVAVRFEVRQTLRRDLAREEEAAFANDCRRILASIHEDLDLRVATALLSYGFCELDEREGTLKERREKAEALWKERLHQTAVELCQVHPVPGSLFSFLHELDTELKRAGNHPRFGSLFEELGKANPTLAAGLARSVLDSGAASSLVREVPVLVCENSALTESERFSLLAKTARSPAPGAAVSTITYCLWRMHQASYAPMTKEAELLFELAARPDADIATSFLHFCERAEEPALELACRILETIPFACLPSHVAGEIWAVLVPYRQRSVPLPKDVVAHLLRQLVAIPKLELHQHWEQFHELTETMPRAVYSLLRDRVLHAASGQAPEDYTPLPEGYDFTIRLPGLAAEPDYAAICDELWQRVFNPREPLWYQWRELWQAVVLNDAADWVPRLMCAVEAAQSAEDLRALV
jgi:hypothetical protein